MKNNNTQKPVEQQKKPNKFKKFFKKGTKSRNIFMQVAASVCLIGASAGLIFGISAATFRINYMDLNNAQTRLYANNTMNYRSQLISSEWNMDQSVKPLTQNIQLGWWKQMHHDAPMISHNDPAKSDYYGPTDTTEWNKLTPDQQNTFKQRRYEYCCMVLDGVNHTELDHSFNESMYRGFVNYINNKVVDPKEVKPQGAGATNNSSHAYRPSQETPTYFKTAYNSAAQQHSIIGLAGFNHVTPLSSLGTYNARTKIVDYGDKDTAFDKTCFLLVDGDVENNQNIASVLFRSDQPGFLSAVATAMYFMNNVELYHDQGQDISVGVYGGTTIPTVTIYMGGFQRGIEFFNAFILSDMLDGREILTNKNDTTIEYDPVVRNMFKFSKTVDFKTNDRWAKIETRLTDKEKKKLMDEYSVKVIKLGDAKTHFTGTFNSGDAIGITKQFLNRKASAILAVAGPQALDSAQEIQNQNSKCIVVGVDSPTEDGDAQRQSKYTDKTKAPDGSASGQSDKIIKFSSVKDVMTVTQKISELIQKGQNWDVSGEKWNHNFVPQYEPEKIITLNPGNCDWETISGGGIIIKKFHPTLVIDPKEIVIPKTFEITDTKTQEVSKVPIRAISDYAFVESKDSKARSLLPTSVETIKIEPDNIDVGECAFANAINISYLDFSSISDLDKDKVVFHKNSLVGSNQEQKGMVIVDRTQDRTKLNNFVASLQDPMRACLDPLWFADFPDIDKSICSMGFQTCGNIENGLISISWDGWYYLMQALGFTKPVVVDKDGKWQSQEFKKIWQDHIHGWNEKELSPELKDEFENYDKILTFNRDSNAYKNYSVLTAVLGSIFKEAYYEFDRNMTLIPSEDGKSFVIPPEGVGTPLTVLDWLKYNMYFSC